MFSPGDSVVVTNSFKTQYYSDKNWKKCGKGTFKLGAPGVCLGGGKYVIQFGPFSSVRYGVQFSDSEATKHLAKRN
jgi:hypothetical protein